jgi:aspartate carbamoyltransferase regulatory subunit
MFHEIYSVRKIINHIPKTKQLKVADCFRMAGQNPTLEDSMKMTEEAEESCK